MKTIKKIAGMWWFSDQDSKTAIAGDLFIKEKKLELNGSLEGLKSGTMGISSKLINKQKEKTILGISKKGGKKYTLEYYNEPAYSMSFPGYKADTYSLATVFQGGHFAKTNKLSFSKYNVDFPYLFEWINDGVIATEIIFKNQENKEPLEKTIIRIGKLKKVSIFKKNDFKLWYITRAKKTPIFPSREMNISQECYFQIESLKKEISIKEFYSIVSHLERFLIIAIGRVLEPTSYQAIMKTSRHNESIEIFPHTLKHREYTNMHTAEMHFTFSDIKKDSQNIFKNWFSQKEKHEDVFNLFSAINSDTSKNLNNQFKDILSTIEGYIRIEKNKLDIDLDKTIKTLNEKLPKNNRVFIKNDYNKIRITRNKLTHIAIKPEDEKYILTNKEKCIYFYKLKFLLEYSFLKDMGISKELLEKFYEKKNISNI